MLFVNFFLYHRFRDKTGLSPSTNPVQLSLNLLKIQRFDNKKFYHFRPGLPALILNPVFLWHFSLILGGDCLKVGHSCSRQSSEIAQILIIFGWNKWCYNIQVIVLNCWLEIGPAKFCHRHSEA